MKTILYMICKQCGADPLNSEPGVSKPLLLFKLITDIKI